MQAQIRKIFWFILAFFERGTEPYAYKPLNRKILIAVGVLFWVLGGVSVALMPDGVQPGYLIPVIVFGVVGLVCLLVGTVGSDRAVAKIWGNR